VNFTGDVAHSAYRLDTIANNASLSVTYYNDAAQTQFIAQQAVDVAPGVNFGQSMPCLGPYMVVALTARGGGITYNLFVFSVGGPVMDMSGVSTENILITQDVLTVGAGATVDTNAIRVWPGQAFWYVTSGAATWSARLQSVDGGGTVRTLDLADQLAQKNTRHVFLPATPVRIRINNPTAAAQDFAFTLTARIFVPGS
jgi:hypothetical protein